MKEKRVLDKRVKMSRRMQALKKAKQGLRHWAYKKKAKEEKLQYTFQIDPDMYIDKNLNDDDAKTHTTYI